MFLYGAMTLKDSPISRLLYAGIGVWRSLVAHLIWDQRDGSSNLSTPTSTRFHARLTLHFLHWSNKNMIVSSEHIAQDRYENMRYHNWPTWYEIPPILRRRLMSFVGSVDSLT